VQLNYHDEVIKCACILYNLNPHQEINFKILNEVFFNKKIDISKLKVFGCKVFFLKRYKQGKFENNTKPGIFLGYSSDSPGYRVLDITSKAIIIVRDAYFNESTLGSLGTSTFHSSNPSDKQI